MGQNRESRRAAGVRAGTRAVHRLDELEYVSGSPRTAAVVQVRQSQSYRCRGAASGDRAQSRMSRDRRRAGSPRAYRLDWRRRQFPWAAALPACARSLSRQHDGDLSRAAGDLAAVHRAQVLRARLLFDGPERLGHELLLRAGARRPRVLAGRSRPSRSERERRDDRREADSIRQARRLSLQRQPVRRRRPRCGVGEAVSAVPDFQRARRRRALGACRDFRPPTCSTNRTT